MPRSTASPPRRRGLSRGIVAAVLTLLALLGVGGYLGFTLWQSYREIQTVLPPTRSDRPQAATSVQWQEEGRINILLLGMDRRPEEGPVAARTDTILVLTVDPHTKTAGMLSIPRDLWLPIPLKEEEDQYDRINTAYVWGDLRGYPGGGAQLARATVEYNFGIPIHYHAVLDFVGFQRIIDTLGGLEMELPEALFDPEYPTPDYDVTTIYIPAGKQRLDGEKALWYARSRYQGGDFGRMKRQQQLLLALRERTLQVGIIPKLPQLSRELADAISTDMPLEAALNLSRLLSSIGPEQVTARSLEGASLTSRLTSGGAQVLVMERERTGEILKELFYDSRLREEAASVKVLNGSAHPGLAEHIAHYLQAQGGAPVSYAEADGRAYRETLVILWGEKPYTAGVVAGLLGLSSDRIRVQHQANSAVDIEVILGDDAPDLQQSRGP